MTPVRDTQKKYCSRSLIIAIICGMGLILADYKPMGKGIILGTLFSILNFILLGETMPIRMAKSNSKAFLGALGSIFIRYVLLAIPLIIAIRSDQFSLPTVIIGIFMVQVTILVDHFLKIITRSQGF